MKLVVGLGNPGARYHDTRHNVGFRVADEMARRAGVAQWREQHQSLVARVQVGADAVLVAKPVTFMNLSGEAVAGLAGFYKVAVPDVLVVLDEVALPLGRLRAGARGQRRRAQRAEVGDRPARHDRPAPAAHRRGTGR